MKILEKIGLALLGAAAIIAIVALRSGGVGGVFNQQLIYSGMTNATSSIGTTATTVLSGTVFSTYARITNTTQNDISCYAENATVASSTIVVGGGISIGRAATTTAAGEPNVCFGAAPGCIPYVGQVNCIASVTTTVGLTYK